ncbi:hypothetical protein R6L23_37175 [Streptomyces sp. SR27]|uniref:hypothetical protein n=1 Tax=Streptomyces sp. SR27 TaxID=3076630 RepID=UPI00295B12A1|nr:hypothetical protein [Streptomyces sp. SR27]MDV9193781.1 hypothetical protein [Streptomyces sp. SR27]
MDSTSVRRTTMDSTVVRTEVVRHRVRHRTTPTMPGTLARAGAPHPTFRTAPVRPAAADPLVRVRPDARDPLVQLCYRDVSP